LICNRYFAVLLILLVAYSPLLIQLDEFSKVSAQPPPYPPLSPSLFKVVGTSWGTSNQTMYAAPGDTNIPLFVTVQNIGNRTATGLSETLFLQESFTNISGGQIARAFYENNIEPGLTATTRFIMNIARNASIGVHILRMQIDYLQIVSGTGTTLYLRKQIEVELPIIITGTSYATIYSINVFPKEVTPGGNVTISGTLVNTATSALSNTNVSFSSPAFSRGTFIYIGQTDPNIPRPFSITVQIQRTLTAGTYPVELFATYMDSLGVTHISSAKTTLSIVQQVYTPSEKPPERSLPDVVRDILWRIFRFLFGSLAFMVLGD